MVKIRDMACNVCGSVTEIFLKDGDALPPCPCGESRVEQTRLVPTAAKMFSTIIPDYPGSKKLKAGYVATYGDKPRTKTQVQGADFK